MNLLNSLALLLMLSLMMALAQAQQLEPWRYVWALMDLDLKNAQTYHPTAFSQPLDTPERLFAAVRYHALPQYFTCGKGYYYKVCFLESKTAQFGGRFSGWDFLDWTACDTVAPANWSASDKAAPIAYDTGPCAMCADNGGVVPCQNSWQFEPAGFGTNFPQCQTGQLASAITLTRTASYCQYEWEDVGPVALLGSPGAATAKCTVAPAQLSKTIPAGTSCSVGGKCDGCNQVGSGGCQHTVLDPAADQSRGPVKFWANCAADCQCTATCFSGQACTRAGAYAQAPDPILTVSPRTETNAASTCADLRWDMKYPATCTSPNESLLTNTQANNSPWCAGQTIHYSSIDSRDAAIMAWNSSIPPHPATCLNPTCSTCSTLDSNPALNVAIIPKEFSLLNDDYTFRWTDNSLCSCQLSQCKKHSSSTTFSSTQDECSNTLSPLLANSQWTPTKAKRVDGTFDELSVDFSINCADYTDFRFTRDVFCSMPGHTAYSGSDCTQHFGVRDLPLSDFTCADPSYTCSSCSAIGPGSGSAQPLTLTKSGASKPIPELTPTAEMIASTCACSAGVRKDAQVTPVTYDYGTYAPLPMCEDGEVIATVNMSPPPADYTCIQQGVDVVEGNCTPPPYTIAAGTSCVAQDAEIFKGCAQCGEAECVNRFVMGTGDDAWNLDVPVPCADDANKAMCDCTTIKCTPLRVFDGSYEKNEEVPCDDANTILQMSYPWTGPIDICATKVKRSERWKATTCSSAAVADIPCSKVAGSYDDARADIATLMSTYLTGQCASTALCLKHGADARFRENYVPCTDVSVCVDSCVAGSFSAAPRCLQTKDATGAAVTGVADSAYCLASELAGLNYDCACTFHCDANPDFDVGSGTPSGDCTDMSSAAFKLPTDCSTFAVPRRTVVKRFNQQNTKLTGNVAGWPAVTRSSTSAEVMELCSPSFQCAATGGSNWGTCTPSDFPTCDPFCGTASRQTSCFVTTASGPMSYADFVAKVNVETASSSPNPPVLKNQISAMNAVVKAKCNEFSSANPATKTCTCTSAFFCQKKDKTGNSFDDVVACSSAAADLATPCAASVDWCSQAKKPYEMVYCRKSDGTLTPATPTALGTCTGTTLTFPTCSSSTACHPKNICHNDPSTPQANLTLDNLANTPGYYDCDGAQFAATCYNNASGTFVESRCTDQAGKTYVNARAGRCIAVNNDNLPVTGDGGANVCPTQPTLTKASCRNFEGCDPAYIQGGSFQYVTPFGDRRDRQPLTFTFGYRGQTAVPLNNLNVQWSWWKYGVPERTWVDFVDGKNLDETKGIATVTLPRADRSYTYLIMFRIFLGTNVAAAVQTGTQELLRRDSCAHGDLVCSEPGTECVDGIYSNDLGYIAKCVCMSHECSTVAPNSISITTPALNLVERKPLAIKFTYRGQTPSTSLCAQWTYSTDVGVDATWFDFVDGKDLDPTKGTITVTLPRLDRSISSDIRVRLYIADDVAAAVESTTFTVKRLDSCAQNDLKCTEPGSECIDPADGDASGVAICACILPTVTADNEFTSTFQCTRTKQCDAVGATKCQNGGHLNFDASVTSSPTNKYQCAAACTCAPGYDPSQDCASCSSTSCVAANGVPRTADQQTADEICGCLKCFPGFALGASSSCALCSRLASITITNLAPEVTALYTGTAVLDWYAKLTQSVAQQLKLSQQWVTVSPLSHYTAASNTVEVVFQLSGDCASVASFTLQDSSTPPSINDVVAAWKTSITLAFLNSDPIFAASTTTPGSFAIQSEPANLATCQETTTCPSYAPTFSCDEYPTHPTCVKTDNNGNDGNENSTPFYSLSVALIVLLGIITETIFA